MKGGSVQNPIHALAQFIDKLHAPNGSVNVEGFYRYAKSHEGACLRFRTSEDVQRFCLAFLCASTASGPRLPPLLTGRSGKPVCFSGRLECFTVTAHWAEGCARGRLRTGQMLLRFSWTRPLRWRAWARSGPMEKGDSLHAH